MTLLWEYGLKKTINKARARLLSRLIRFRETGLPDQFVTSQYGVRMKANWSDRTFQYAYFATYGRALSDLISTRQEPFVFLDVGANQGLYSLIAARNPACAQVIALEPVAATFARLEENIMANKATQILPVRAAFSRSCGESRMRFHAGHSGAATLIVDGDGDTGGETVRLIPAASLQTLIPDGLPILVKVDVEGHEEIVIAELASAAFASRIASLCYEIDERWSDPQRIEAILRGAGFTRFEKAGIGRHYDVIARKC